MYTGQIRLRSSMNVTYLRIRTHHTRRPPRRATGRRRTGTRTRRAAGAPTASGRLCRACTCPSLAAPPDRSLSALAPSSGPSVGSAVTVRPAPQSQALEPDHRCAAACCWWNNGTRSQLKCTIQLQRRILYALPGWWRNGRACNPWILDKMWLF